MIMVQDAVVCSNTYKQHRKRKLKWGATNFELSILNLIKLCMNVLKKIVILILKHCNFTISKKVKYYVTMCHV